MNNLVLDTDIFIDLLRGFEKAKKYFEELNREDNIIYYSAVTEVELISGKECNKIEKKAEIVEILSQFSKIPVDNRIAVKAGDFRREYGTAFADAVIAATAFVMKANLISRNIDDYRKIEEITLRVPY
ncbi:type II toxin-antitoxin system VapC family toxin [Candidatus Woesearchaeota archaeon]|nr:type II toxin-antitoxin system VapC family toxin [Candidatus Woesearchaeota archaeon]